MRFIDLKKQFFLAEERIRARMDAVLEHGQFILRPEVAEFEKRLKDITDAKHCLTCASGSTALDLIMLAWQFGPGDAVFTSPFTFAATAESIARTGATPIFVDIDPASFNIDAAQLAQAVGAVLSGDPHNAKLENYLLWSACFATHLIPSMDPPHTNFLGGPVFGGAGQLSIPKRPKAACLIVSGARWA